MSVHSNRIQSSAIFTIALVSVLLGLALLAMSMAGCAPQDTTFAREQAAQARATLDTQKAAATADLTKAQAAGDTKAADRAAKTLDTISELESRLAKAEEMLASVSAPDGGIDPAKAAGAAGALLPPPWNIVAMLGVPAIVAAIQELRVRNRTADAVSIINGLSAAQLASPGMTTALKANEAVLKKEYTVGAQKLVKKHKLAST